MTEDLSAYFRDALHTITIGAVTKPCVFFEDDSVALEQTTVGQITSAISAIVITADFPTVKGNDALTITQVDSAGTVISTRAFTVWRRLRIQDGALTELMLKAAR